MRLLYLECIHCSCGGCPVRQSVAPHSNEAIPRDSVLHTHRESTGVESVSPQTQSVTSAPHTLVQSGASPGSSSQEQQKTQHTRHHTMELAPPRQDMAKLKPTSSMSASDSSGSSAAARERLPSDVVHAYTNGRRAATPSHCDCADAALVSNPSHFTVAAAATLCDAYFMVWGGREGWCQVYGNPSSQPAAPHPLTCATQK